MNYTYIKATPIVCTGNALLYKKFNNLITENIQIHLFQEAVDTIKANDPVRFQSLAICEADVKYIKVAGNFKWFDSNGKCKKEPSTTRMISVKLLINVIGVNCEKMKLMMRVEQVREEEEESNTDECRI